MKHQGFVLLKFQVLNENPGSNGDACVWKDNEGSLITCLKEISLGRINAAAQHERITVLMGLLFQHADLLIRVNAYMHFVFERYNIVLLDNFQRTEDNEKIINLTVDAAKNYRTNQFAKNLVIHSIESSIKTSINYEKLEHERQATLILPPTFTVKQNKKLTNTGLHVHISGESFSFERMPDNAEGQFGVSASIRSSPEEMSNSKETSIQNDHVSTEKLEATKMPSTSSKKRHVSKPSSIHRPDVQYIAIRTIPAPNIHVSSNHPKDKKKPNEKRKTFHYEFIIKPFVTALRAVTRFLGNFKTKSHE